MTKIVLIPAYNPDEILNKLLDELSEKDVKIIVVNDGSSDECDIIFQLATFKATVLRHNINKGKGQALKTGLTYIRRNFSSPYVVVTADADGQHRVKDILRTAELSERFPDNLILGSRKIDDSVPLRSKIGNTLTRKVFQLSTGKYIYDTHTGLRAFSDKAIDFMLNVSGNRYEYEMNVLMQWVKQEKPYKELKITTLYLNQNKSSHFNPVKDSYRIYKEIIRFSASSLASFVLDYGLFNLFLLILKMMGIAYSLVIANITARVISATFNYQLNRKVVFKSDTSLKKSVFGYMTLATGILIGNTLLLQLFTTLGIASFVAKIIAEVMMFFISWLVQRKLIFKKKKTDTPAYKKELMLS